MNYFKGYVKTKNKESIEGIKGKKKFKKIEEVQNLPEYAGVLSENVMLVDVDDADQADVLLGIIQDLNVSCRIYNTTRGKHFLFKNTDPTLKNSNKAKCAIGITIDYKGGHKNAYEILKIDGVKRQMVQDSDDPDEIPQWLLPVRSKYDFWNMDSGSGRNQALFEYILVLQSDGYTKEQARECIKIINDYILMDPLEQSELDTILRDDSFKKTSFQKGNQFLFDKFAQFLKSEYQIIRLHDLLHFYKEGIYVCNYKELEAQMIKHLPTINKAKRNEVMAYLELIAEDDDNDTSDQYIAFRNGIFDLKSNKLMSFDPSMKVTNKIPWDFNENAYYELTDHTLNKISGNDAGIRIIIEEMIGYAMFRRATLGKAFVLIGEKDNGKSTLLDMIINLLGKRNVSALDLRELSERFKTAELVGKLANIGDDISGEYVQDTGVFKKIVTGNPINTERKGKDPFDFTNYATLIFSANSIPRLGKGKDNAAIAKRLHIVPLKAKFSVNDPDFRPNIKYDLRDQRSMEYLIKIGIEGLQRALENKRFTETEDTIKELKEYEITNNPVLGFAEENNRNDFINEKVSDAFDAYRSYCLINGLHPLSNKEFSKQIISIWNLKSRVQRVDGKSCRIYVSDETEDEND